MPGEGTSRQDGRTARSAETRKGSEENFMKVLVSDKLAPEGVKILEESPDIEVTVQQP